MDVQHPLPGRFGQVEQAAVLGVDEMDIGCAVIEHVNTAKRRHYLGYQRLHLGAVGHIDQRSPCLPTRGCDCLYHPLGFGPIDIGHHHSGSFGSKGFGPGPSHPRTAAGHNRYLSLHATAHLCSSLPSISA